MSEIDRLAKWVIKNCPEEIGRGDFVHGESAVDVAIRLLETAKERHLVELCDTY